MGDDAAAQLEFLRRMEDDAAAQLELLRRNDPSETKVSIHLREHADEMLSVSAALQANNHISEVILGLHGIGNTNWDFLLCILATRETLETVTLFDVDDHSERNPPEQVTPFLLAMQQNPRIQTVLFRDLQVPGDSVASFLDAAASVTAIEFRECGMKAPGGALAVAAALQRICSAVGTICAR